MSKSPSIFAFNSHPIRTNVRNGQIWFVARDICSVLGISWTGTALVGIQADWQGLWSDHNLNTNQRLKFINEPAVYKLAFRSNKPEADAFTNWVASEVLPAIRRTGRYETKPKSEQLSLPAPDLAQVERRRMAEAHIAKLRGLCNEFHFASERLFTLFVKDDLVQSLNVVANLSNYALLTHYQHIAGKN